MWGGCPKSFIYVGVCEGRLQNAPTRHTIKMIDYHTSTNFLTDGELSGDSHLKAYPRSPFREEGGQSAKVTFLMRKLLIFSTIVEFISVI